MPHTRRELVTMLLLAAAACGPRAPVPYRHAPIVLISLDTLRADAVTGYGAAADATPALAAFAREAILFETAIAASHHTAPSHATLFTGFSPPVHRVAFGAGGRLWPIPPQLPTLAETLAAAGYATAGLTDGIMLVPEGAFDRGFETFIHQTDGLDGKLDTSRRIIENAGEHPLFLFVHTYRAHQPYRAPKDLLPELLADYEGVYREAAAVSAGMSHREVMRPPGSRVAADALKILKPARARTDADRLFFHRLYRAGVTGGDREFGRFVAMLRETGLLDRAIVVVTSDHGEAFFEHKVGGHADVFDENLRVPLLVRLPDGRGAGTRVAGTFPAVDLMPTLLDLVRVTPRVTPEGRSHADRLLGGGDLEEGPAFSAWLFGAGNAPAGLSMRAEGFKWIEVNAGSDMPRALYGIDGVASFDLRVDPGEQNNLGGSRSKALARQRSVWDVHRAELGIGDTPARSLTDDTLERLKALGYVGDVSLPKKMPRGR